MVWQCSRHVNSSLSTAPRIIPVPVNSKVRARHKIAGAELKGANTIQLKREVTVELEGSDKPVCVAESLIRYMYAD